MPSFLNEITESDEKMRLAREASDEKMKLAQEASNENMKLAREAFDEKMRLAQQKHNFEPLAAKEAALNKISEAPGTFHSRGPLGFTNLNKRQFGPYELDTMLDSDSSQDDKTKFAKLSHLIRFKGGQHSPEDAKKLANELRDIKKPIDPNLIREITSLPQWTTEGDPEYIKTISRQAQNKPLWNK